ncbi:GtrA family protein [Cohnella panacarvi]|uniref:GtrA family protein n=1 Tax=Cohnella panacarvi TaxID=400776 RepID=UPI0004789692|nr:GtrA family protein [Cohnella panacarvi]
MNIDRALRSPFVKYAVVGALGTLLHFASLIFLVEAAELPAVLSSAIGFLLVVVVSYYLNRHWTFSKSAASPAPGSFARYAVVSTSGLVLNTAIMYAIVDAIGWPYLLGQAAVTVIVPVSNYYFNRTWTFKERAPGTTKNERGGRP